MLHLNKKLRIMCAAAALTLAALPVSCGSADDTNNSAANGVNSNGIYDGSNDNGMNQGNNIIDDAADAIQNGANSVMSGIDGIDDGMTNNSTTTSSQNSRTTTTSNHR